MSEQPGNGKRHSFGGSLLMFGLMVATIASVVWANLWKSDLRIADVRVQGTLIVAEKEILALANINKDQKLYDVDLLAAQRRIRQNAFVKSVVVSREAPNRISISVQERTPIAAVVLDNIRYLDAEGVVLPPAQSENIFDLPVLTGAFQNGEFGSGKQVEKSDVREALEILVTAREFSDELYRRISEVHLEPGRDIILYTAECGVPVIFGRGDVAMKLAKLDGFWKDVVPHHGAHELAYIDVRFEDQVVVRWNHDSEETQATRTVAGQSPKGKRS
jgi:cell division protein FtsQ